MTNFTSTFGIISRRAFTTALIAAPMASPAFAHRERSTLTEIEWEDNPGFLYVTHSFHIHEAERTLYKAGVIDKPDLYSLKTRAQLALFVEDNFSLRDKNDRLIPLEILGAESMGGDCFVYQQADLEEKPMALSIHCNLMRALEPSQINNVDVKLSDTVKSVQFRGDDDMRRIEF